MTLSERQADSRFSGAVSYAEMMARAEDSLRRLASQLLARSAAVSRWEQTDDVLQESLLRLYQALQATRIESPLHFYRLSALQIRRVLIDFARRYRGPYGLASNHGTGDVSRWSLEQCRADEHDGELTLAEWSEFHRIVNELPQQEREVFDLLWYAELSTREAAEVLGVGLRTVQRRWRRARLLFCRRWQAEVECSRWLDGCVDEID